jgi:hypothetical protein
MDVRHGCIWAVCRRKPLSTIAGAGDWNQSTDWSADHRLKNDTLGTGMVPATLSSAAASVEAEYIKTIEYE